jgi:SOS-response transcriptional repressor LexA
MKGEVERGDLVVVSPALRSSIKDGDLVVVRMDDSEVVLKRFVRAGGRAILTSSNPSYPPIILDAARSPAILGKVLYAIRHYK